MHVQVPLKSQAPCQLSLLLCLLEQVPYDEARCYKQQSLKLIFCNASGSLISISNALRWQRKRWLFPCLSLMQAGLWCCHLARIMESNEHHWRAIHPPCLTHLFQDDRTFRGTYFCLDCKGPCLTSSIPTRLTALKSEQMLFTWCVIYNMNQDCRQSIK